ncbi:MAG: hypothetical protein ABI970_05440 [Chloroflexota bacterium]|nr:hypothetical protein [Anaerolineae bacterium]
MLKSPLLPRVLLGLIVVAIVLVIVGILFVFDNTNRYNQLAAIDLQPLIDTMKDNELNAHTVADVEIRKHQAEVARDEAFALIGGGAILLGLVSLVYTRLPDKPAATKIA